MLPHTVLRLMLCTTAATFVATRAAPAHAQGAGGNVLIGYVNLQRAILEVEEGKRAKKDLKKTFDEKQKKLSDKEAELVKLKDVLEKEAVGKDDPETRKKVTDFQAKLMDLRQVFMKEQQELQEAEGKLISGITAKMRPVIDEIGNGGGYTLILEMQDARLLFAKSHLDLTNEVIRKYNAKNK